MEDRVDVAPAALDAVHAAALLLVSRRTWLYLVASGRAPAGFKLNALRRWSRAELLAWIDAGCPSAARWEEAKR